MLSFSNKFSRQYGRVVADWVFIVTSVFLLLAFGVGWASIEA
ncbi:MAG: hypothetical protein ACU0CA_08310 [Paracoccaceae bacterium]